MEIPLLPTKVLKSKPHYKRVLLKISGEFLMGNAEFGIDPSILDDLAKDIKEVVELGVELALVIGGGNLFRGKTLSKAGLGRVTGDHMGMLATVMNSLAIRDALERVQLPVCIMSAIHMEGVVDAYNQRKAIQTLEQKQIVIISAGTGNPFFTTDTAACLRAIEINADVVLKATKVNGVYSEDPIHNPKATYYPTITYNEIVQKDLQVMDLTAICLCRDYGMPLHIFNIKNRGILKDIILGKKVGTTVHARST